MSTLTLDCRQLLCPLPVIRVQDAVANLVPGNCVKALCTDPGALQDIPAWCRINGHAVIESGGDNGECYVLLRVGGMQESRELG